MTLFTPLFTKYLWHPYCATGVVLDTEDVTVNMTEVITSQSDSREIYSQLSMFRVVTLYKVTANTELVNSELLLHTELVNTEQLLLGETES